jgi:nitronate monooxygenase
MFRPGELEVPIVAAPLAGGPSTPALAAAVAEAGGLGFLAAGYHAPSAVAEGLAKLRAATARPVGVNVFVPGRPSEDRAAVDAYRVRVAGEASRLGVEPGEARFDDDGYAAKLELLERAGVAVVSFTFGCPGAEDVARMHAAGSAVWVTVTESAEADQAVAAGADGLVLQGVEAGGHRGTFVDADGAGELPLDDLLAEVAALGLGADLIAAGGIATRERVREVLAAGAVAAQIGTAFMLCPEAGTSEAHRAAIARPGATRLTRAFSGRRARGIVNAFMEDHDAEAPSAYPEVHHLTSPIRAAARAAGDADAINLWAGTAHELAMDIPAAEVVRRLAP